MSPITARAIRLAAKATDAASIAAEVMPLALSHPSAGNVLIEIHAAAVNPSDVKAAIGMMPYAVFPRTPGRDFAGVVLEGPAHNFIIHTAPLQEGQMLHFHWHVEIMPKLTKVAGFEWGTGFYINPTSPEESAKFLRQAKR